LDILVSLNAPQGTVTTGEDAAYKGAASAATRQADCQLQRRENPKSGDAGR